MNNLKRLLLLVGLVALVFAGWAYLRGRREIRAARERVAEGGEIAQTEAGAIEYTTGGGDGPPVLVIHGAGGGYDQGAILASMLLGDEFRWIAPSRFGYLGSPLPEDASLAAQADALAALLDELGIERVAVVGVSAGGPPALQFALRHPERVTALLMAAAISDAPYLVEREPAPVSEGAYKMLLQQDGIFWLLKRYAPSTLMTMFGVPEEVQSDLSSDEKAWAADFVDSILPVSMRYEGMINDMEPRPRQEADTLGRIDAPTLVIHAADDTLVPIREGEFSAQTIPGADFIVLPEGGHLLLGHHDEVQSQVIAFLKQHVEAGE